MCLLLQTETAKINGHFQTGMARINCKGTVEVGSGDVRCICAEGES